MPLCWRRQVCRCAAKRQPRPRACDATDAGSCVCSSNGNLGGCGKSSAYLLAGCGSCAVLFTSVGMPVDQETQTEPVSALPSACRMHVSVGALCQRAGCLDLPVGQVTLVEAMPSASRMQLDGGQDVHRTALPRCCNGLEKEARSDMLCSPRYTKQDTAFSITDNETKLTTLTPACHAKAAWSVAGA